jgi:putative transposase
LATSLIDVEKEVIVFFFMASSIPRLFMVAHPRDDADCNMKVEVGRKTPSKGIILDAEMPLMLFCTVCAKQRGSWVAQAEVMHALHEIGAAEATAWRVGPYVLMPDHVHFLCIPQNLQEGVEIETWTAFWKQRFSRKVNQREWRWQRGIFHHRLRNDFQLQEKLEYMRQNPVRKGLVEAPELRPWRGEVHDLKIVMRQFTRKSES